MTHKTISVHDSNPRGFVRDGIKCSSGSRLEKKKSVEPEVTVKLAFRLFANDKLGDKTVKYKEAGEMIIITMLKGWVDKWGWDTARASKESYDYSSWWHWDQSNFESRISLMLQSMLQTSGPFWSSLIPGCCRRDMYESLACNDGATGYAASWGLTYVIDKL